MTALTRPSGRLDQVCSAQPSHDRQGPGRASAGLIEWVHDRLSERDWHILYTVNQLRVVSGMHIQDLFFHSLPSPRSRVASRSRALRRLASWRVLVPLERRIGGDGRGSSGAVFALDSVGQRLIAQAQLADGQRKRLRRPRTPTDRTLKHALDVSDLYVRLVVLNRDQGVAVEEYTVEPRWPDGLGGCIASDAYVRLSLASVVDHWWVEADRATQDLETTILNKLKKYLDFVRRGQLGPGGVVPRVLISTISERRRQAIEDLVRRLPPPADALFAVVDNERAAAFLTMVLRE